MLFAVPMLVLLTVTLWTVLDFWLYPIRDVQSLPWPARRCLREAVVVAIIWTVTTLVYWRVFRSSMVYQGLGVGFTWGLVTLYVSTGLRQRALDRLNRDRGW